MGFTAGIHYKPAGKRREQHERCEYEYPHVEFFWGEVIFVGFLCLCHHFTFPIKSNKNISCTMGKYKNDPYINCLAAFISSVRNNTDAWYKNSKLQTNDTMPTA